jgi:hypothetical protein
VALGSIIAGTGNRCFGPEELHMRGVHIFVGFVFVLALSGAAVKAANASEQLSATMVASEVLVGNGVADATFTIEITNGDAAAATNVRVVFSDGAEVAIGDVDPGGTVSSGAERRTITLETDTHYYPVPVTLKYSTEGADVEASAVLILRIS